MAFAELEKFIDTPVKHYSSGMYVRLAFAVAAHLEPEILLVDEVLAVGDINFQKKCLGKMGDVARAGRTVVLVSHNMAAINALSTTSDHDEGWRHRFRWTDLRSHGALLFGIAGHGGKRKPAFWSAHARGTARRDFRRFPCSRSIRPEDALTWPIPAAISASKLRFDCRSEIADCNLAIIIYEMNGFRVVDTNTAQKGEFVSFGLVKRRGLAFCCTTCC